MYQSVMKHLPGVAAEFRLLLDVKDVTCSTPGQSFSPPSVPSWPWIKSLRREVSRDQIDAQAIHQLLTPVA